MGCGRERAGARLAWCKIVISKPAPTFVFVNLVANSAADKSWAGLSMLHCWQPKHKYNLNGCQTAKSRGKDLQPWKRKGDSNGIGKGLLRPLVSLLGANFGKGEREAVFRLLQH